MVEPCVSVVLPVFNGARFIAAALESVAAQTEPALEAIVVDDGSTDGSGEIAARCPAARVLRQENRGVSAARNAGIAAARGRFVAFLDVDDMWRPEKLARQRAALDAHPEAGFSVCSQEFILDEGVGRPPWLTPDLLATPRIWYIPSALLARRECLERVGGFDEGLRRLHEDTDWFIRAFEAGFKGARIDDVLLVRRVHASNRTLQADPSQRDLLPVIAASLARRRARERDPGKGGPP